MTVTGISQARAVKNALARLGLQASTQEVVAFLANYDVQVRPTLVQQVRRVLLKEAQRTRRPKGAMPNTRGRLQARLPPKMPQPHHFHR